MCVTVMHLCIIPRLTCSLFCSCVDCFCVSIVAVIGVVSHKAPVPVLVRWLSTATLHPPFPPFLSLSLSVWAVGKCICGIAFWRKEYSLYLILWLPSGRGKIVTISNNCHKAISSLCNPSKKWMVKTVTIFNFSHKVIVTISDKGCSIEWSADNNNAVFPRINALSLHSTYFTDYHFDWSPSRR